MGDIKKKWTSIKEKEILFVFVREKFLSDRVTKKAAISRANPVFMHRCEGLVAQWPWPVDQYQERYLLKRSRVAAFHLMCSHKQVLVRRSVSARLRRSSAPHLSGPAVFKPMRSLSALSKRAVVFLDGPDAPWWLEALNRVACCGPKDCVRVVSTCQ